MPTGPNAPSPGDAALRISLNVMLGAAIADAVFLVALLVALALGGRSAATVPAALYAFGFIYLLYLAAKGAMERRWGWSYLALIAVTLGPVGAIIGGRRMRERLPAAAPPETPTERPTRKEERKAAADRRRADR
jgi:CDP-diglyceride synthetase